MSEAEAVPAGSAMMAINASVYEQPEAVRVYTAPTLLASEVAILVKYAADICGRRVLDVACGAGRTTHYLRHMASEYTGMDVAERMLAHCRAQPQFERLTFIQRDMRDVGAFGVGAFDFVLISANGIDHLDHDDRLSVLHKVRSVLAPGGLLVFSAHNKVYLDQVLQGEVPVPDLARLFRPGRLVSHPIRQIDRLRRTLRIRRNHARLRSLQRFTDDYSIVVGQAHEHGLLSYWIGPAAQLGQIAAAGYELLDVYDTYGGAGQLVDPAGDTQAHSALYYVCRNPGSATVAVA